MSIDLFLWHKPGVLFNEIPKEVNIISEQLYPGSFGAIKDRNIFKRIIKYFWYFSYRIAGFLKQPVKVFKPLKKEYDIAISYCQNGYAPHYVAEKVKAKEKYLWYHHGSYEETGIKKKIDEKYFSKYTKIIPVSNSCKAMLCEAFPKLCDKMFVIPNFIDERSILQKSNEPIANVWDGGCKITTVGRISSEKGQLFALDVAEKLAKANFDFTWVFVGEGPDLQKCREKAKILNLPQCKFVGVKTNPYPYMKQADVYVQPSFVESEAITVKEAKCLNKPVVASDISALSENLEGYALGCICSLKVEEFANKIINYSRIKTDTRKISKISDNETIANRIEKLLFRRK